MASQLAKKLASIRPVWRFSNVETDEKGWPSTPNGAALRAVAGKRASRARRIAEW